MDNDNLSWQHWSEREANNAYDNGAAVLNVNEITQQWRVKSDLFAAIHPQQEKIIFGQHDRQQVQLFFPKQHTSRIVIFIHGGYWQNRAKEDFYFLSDGFIQQGISIAHLGYPLAPEFSLKNIIDSINLGLSALHQHYMNQFDHWTICGWSAGAHLALMSHDYTWINKRLLISGIYDLTPLQKTRYYRALKINGDEINLLSPIQSKTHSSIDTELWVGTAELAELIRQTKDYAKVAGLTQSLTLCEGDNHFTILDRLTKTTLKHNHLNKKWIG
ncbi:alpha/beta hydrolase fold domain-containing protein [Ferrovum sp. PN-J185]|uniref:alpha/beta hydrolase n=1 Tax=Ferrovum sp. PN-J185 TaxID=1356306 RepID=UPI0007956C82|nr:alpha/beta hydrolase fold domain-containing protein [Ferrovum sp. PN-J185]KXW56413.1 hypothetical protein FV185_03610 [Ferrovum sp. PN-J185]MCC6069136.1 alpha/beta hydrolase fold domain-containing protein [Ferrovum sp. PN-J185]MDE1890883.1 alpha/beta hydrolase fold domain-containing protein [Betaproteobacteria bacterium]MDE2055805.1 alpha/beta hydrolase fold domain-containing protein [Betaproteobacteria bacterium]